jgi:RNA polymerase sigma-70 factor, ECF subfamily
VSETNAWTGDEASLIARLRLGDENAMAALYDKYSAAVYSVALSVLKDAGTAEDVQKPVSGPRII